MSGFSAEWLRLREPADAAARNPELTARLIVWRRRYDALSVLDLGSGAGANVRILAPALGGKQHWRLVDHDPALLARADEALRRWAVVRGMKVTDESGTLLLEDETRQCRLEWSCLDLNADWERLAVANAQLVTASALIDLVSADWLERLARRCRQWRAAVLIVLSYDGSIVWEPAAEGDEWMREWINRHQGTDKGFGPALGPDAAPTLATLLERLDYRVELRPSPWRLAAQDAALQTALLDGWTEAVRRIAPETTSWLDAWSRHRCSLIERGHSRLSVGHWDLFASLE
ncbi:MAG: class I SAM-dependent methyltransferase [Candidatus Competibacter sp.]|nr:class I SAM-dependent methyltransferase [Candidatus Competibacter sp.]MDG4583093.1 class I SAM-dependent methyltransferase [Candidatus Competibacter sp.]